MITFKTIKGNNIVTVNGVPYEFSDLNKAWKFVFAVHYFKNNK